MEVLRKLFDINNPLVFWAAVGGTLAFCVAIGRFIIWAVGLCPSKKDKTSSTTRSARKTPTVLIIEDTASWRDSLLSMVEEAGYSVQTVASYRDARTALEKEKFDWILADMKLPDGMLAEEPDYELLRLLRETWLCTYFVAVTGVLTTQKLEHLINKGLVDEGFHKNMLAKDPNEFIKTLVTYKEVFNYIQDRSRIDDSVSAQQKPLNFIADSLKQLGTCVAGLPNWDDSTEKAIQNVVYVVLRSQYKKIRREAKVGDGSQHSYCYDFLVEDVNVIVEVKRVRNPNHARNLQAELNDDLAGYPKFGIVFLIWDRERYINDRELFSSAFEDRDSRVRVVFAP